MYGCQIQSMFIGHMSWLDLTLMTWATHGKWWFLQEWRWKNGFFAESLLRYVCSHNKENKRRLYKTKIIIHYRKANVLCCQEFYAYLNQRAKAHDLACGFWWILWPKTADFELWVGLTGQNLQFKTADFGQKPWILQFLSLKLQNCLLVFSPERGSKG